MLSQGAGTAGIQLAGEREIKNDISQIKETTRTN
jgi:hypothetical protein